MRARAAAYGDEPGAIDCGGVTNLLGIGPPLLSGFAHNGQTLWTEDFLYGTPSNTTTTNWKVYGQDYWFTGSAGITITWTNYYTHVPSANSSYGGALDWWTINPGWFATVVQYVYADGYWQWNIPSLTYCLY